MRYAVAVLLICASSWCPCQAVESAPAARESGDPVQIARDFYTAVVLQDRATVERLAVPTDASELDWLFRLEGPHPDYFDAIRDRYATVSVVELKPGDVLKLSDTEVELAPSLFEPDRLLLHFEGQAVPTFLRKVNGQWRVEPEGCIAGSKARVAAFPLEVAAAENAVRQFLVAVMLKDRELLKKHIIPYDKGELNWLMIGQSVPLEQHDECRAFFERLPIKRLEVGDVVDVPGGASLVLDAHHVNATRMQLLPQGAPIPTIVLKMKDGSWKVDPATFIAGRKAASAHRATERLK